MSGMDMLLVNALKAFVPKDVAEKLSEVLQGMIEDGTFEKIASLPSDVAEIKRAIIQLHLGMATIAAHISALESRTGAPARNPLHDSSDVISHGIAPTSFAEHRSGELANCGSPGGTGGEPDNGYGEPVAANGGA